MPLKKMLLLIPCALLTAGVTGAFAFTEFVETKGLEIPRPGWVENEGVWIEKTESHGEQQKTLAVSRLVQRYGGGWHYNRNSLTGTLHRVYGSGVDFTSSLGSKAEAENAAREFISANTDLFGAANADLRTSVVNRGAGKWAVHFEQIVDGIRVVGGRAHIIFTESGRLFVLGSDVYPDVAVNRSPTLSEAEALSIAENDIGFLDGRDRAYYRELVILPTRVAEGEIMKLDYYLAYRFDLDVQDPFGNWVTYVDAHSGEILWRENVIPTIDFTGHSQADVEYESYCDPATANYPAEGMQIDVSGVGTAYCDVNGDFTLSYGGTDTRTYTAQFRGLWLDVDRFTGSDALQTGNITPGSPLTIDWSDANSLPAERDCFSYINEQHRWLLDLDPSFTEMDYQAPCVVERTDFYCPGNAWYSFGSRSINFCKEGGGYGNTGRMADVAYHEYGHGITHQVYQSTTVPRKSLHEGNSDIAANLLTRESIIGLGFYLNNCTSGIRNSNNNMQYPQDWSDSHTGGQIIAGFVWDSWQALLGSLPQAQADSVARHGWHFSRRLGLPLVEEDQVFYTFVADDDDGNLDNGTPNYTEWCAGAMNHNFSCPSPMSIIHTPVTLHTNENDPIEIAASITSGAAPINESALRVWYQIEGGGLLSVGMASTGGDNYSGFIPAQSVGAMVEYYIYAEDNLSNSATDPADAPLSLHRFYVGSFQTLFSDDFETDQGWTAGLPGDDATTGMWELGDPQGTTVGSAQVQPEDDHTILGTDCYATQLAAGSSAGSFDIDNGKTTLLSPVIDLSSASVATVQYWRWYTNNLGASPGSDIWEVQVTDDGSNWVYLENTSSSANSWNLFSFRLNDFISLTQDVQFRFIASDEGSGSLVEAAVDDFEVAVISAPTVDPDLSTIVASDNAVLCPAGDGDSTLAITVTVHDSTDAPVQGIPASDVVVTISGVSAVGGQILFCGQDPDTASFTATNPTDGSGSTTILVNNAGGCGSLTIGAIVSGIPINNTANVSMKSADIDGDGIVDFPDAILFVPMIDAASGYCGNFSNDAGGLVDFTDIIDFLPHLLGSNVCP